MPSKPESPDALFSVDQYRWMLRNSNKSLRHILRFLWNTGCRPEEASRVRRAWVDVSSRTIRFPTSASKGRRARTIVYPLSIDRMIRRIMKHASSEFLLTNTKGTRWTAYAIDSAFDRFEQWNPELFPDGCYARMFRYSFATRMIKRGVDLITLSHLMGHADLSMLRRHYAKIGGDVSHLRDAIDRRSSRPSMRRRAESE
jgi:integrase